MAIFLKNKNYSLRKIIDICDKNGLITVDCLKVENMISVEKEGADCLFEFHKTDDDLFELTWLEADINRKKTQEAELEKMAKFLKA